MYWEELPEELKKEEIKEYFKIISEKKRYFFFKRVFDIIFSFLLIMILSPVMVIISLLIKIDSDGPIIFKQIRVTKNYRKFSIYKFRTMTVSRNLKDIQITVGEDLRITRVGKIIRKIRLDELPQLINILKGDMSFVGVRPEVPTYVDHYSEEMMATLLVRAGVTSMASIKYKDESKILEASSNPEKDYIQEVLPAKMKINLTELKNCNFFYDLKILCLTLVKVVQ